MLEKESLPLLKEQIWDDLNDDLTERYEKTADVTLTESDRVVHIIGLRKNVGTAKKQIERFMEENTIKTDLFSYRFAVTKIHQEIQHRRKSKEYKGIYRSIMFVIKVRGKLVV